MTTTDPDHGLALTRRIRAALAVLADPEAPDDEARQHATAILKGGEA